MADTQIEQLLRQMIAQSEAHTKAMEALIKRVNSLTQIPFGVLFMCLASWFFYIGKISEIYWILSCSIAALPYYSEYVPMVFKIWNTTKTPTK
jgi:hypothetical protein